MRFVSTTLVRIMKAFGPSNHQPTHGVGKEQTGAGKRFDFRRIFIFLLLFTVMQTPYSHMQGTWLERLVIDQITVGTAAWLIDAADPSVQVRAEGARLRAPGGGINVLNGCEGTDVAFLLIAAMAVAPIAWRYRWLGMAAGLVLVFAANQVRVVLLFYAFRHDRALFDALHGVVAPMVLIAVVALFFAAWLARFSSRVSVSS